MEMSKKSGNPGNPIIIISMGGGDTDTATITKEKTKVEPPHKWNVIMHNDDFTPMGFVVEVLVKVFKKNRAEATKLMLYIHHNGAGVAGTYPKSIAEDKLARTRELSSAAGYTDFKVTMEMEQD